MDGLPALHVLSDAELDMVAAGKGNKGGGGTVVDIVEISIGELILAPSGNSTVSLSLAGIGDASSGGGKSTKDHSH